MWHGQSISIIFPAYNEEAGIQSAIREFFDLTFENGTPIVDEIIVVNNNSNDRTADLAVAAGARVILEPRQGYGFALQRGLREAKTDFVVLCEPDGTFLPRDLFKLLAYAQDFEMVCGTRTTKELFWEEANMGIFLRWGNFFVAKMMEFLYGTSSLSDCGCTFRLIRKSALDRIIDDLFVGKSHFLPNMIIAAKLRKISFIEISVNYRGRVGSSKITGTLSGTWKTGMAMIFLILSMWPRYVFGRR